MNERRWIMCAMWAQATFLGAFLYYTWPTKGAERVSPQRMLKLPCAEKLRAERVCTYVVYDSAWGQVRDVVLGEVVEPLR